MERIPCTTPAREIAGTDAPPHLIHPLLHEGPLWFTIAASALTIWFSVWGCRSGGSDSPAVYIVGLQENDGAGGFSARVDTVVTPTPQHVPPRLGDLDGDQHADLVVTTQNFDDVTFGYEITVFLGPTFTTEFARLQTTSVSSMILGDIDGDLDLDIIVGKFGTITVFVSDGSGGFTAVDSATASGVVSVLAAGRISGDTAPDLVATVGFGSSEVFLGDGSGGFSAAGVVVFPTFAELHDMNGDGLKDVITINNTGNEGQILQADGTGGFLAPTSFPFPQQFVHDVAVEDFDGDALPDIVVGLDEKPTLGLEPGIALFLGDGAGGVGPAQETVTFERPFSMTPSDTDGDGDQDIVVWGDPSVHVLENDGAGTFSTVIVGDGTWEPIVGDVTGDGLPDLVFNRYR